MDHDAYMVQQSSRRPGVDARATCAKTSFGARFDEPVKFLPVAFIVSLIVLLYYIYMVYHVAPRYFSTTGGGASQQQEGGSALLELLVFNLVSGMLVVCYILAILVHPGIIPDRDEDPSWDYASQENGASTKTLASVPLPMLEWKRSGDRRQCKWCSKYKPDRCHHCRTCRTCILKMDHHCPWIYNCVGFRNSKYFFLLLFYSVIDCNLIVWTMLPSVKAAADPATPFMTMFWLLFGETLASFVGLIVTLFFGFHIYLMLRAMTTIEFCEKSMKRSSYDRNVYDNGCLNNMKAVLGNNVLLWLLPCSPPEGEGLYFVTEHTRLSSAGGLGATGASPEGAVRRRKQVSDGGGTSGAESRSRCFRPRASGGTGSAPGSPGTTSEDGGSSHHSGGVDVASVVTRADTMGSPPLDRRNLGDAASCSSSEQLPQQHHPGNGCGQHREDKNHDQEHSADDVDKQLDV